jgi:hypothetical protein
VGKRLLVLLGLAGAALAVLKRRKDQDATALWREATSDSSR